MSESVIYMRHGEANNGAEGGEMKYRVDDERYGSEEFIVTIPEMIALYRANSWDEYEVIEEANPPVIAQMTDAEITDDFLTHNVDLI